jgi:lyso-ornithine lipid O-acyltransferase
MAGLIRIAIMAIIIAVVTILLLPFQIFAARAKRFWHKTLPMFWQGLMCKLMGFKVHAIGQMANERPLLLVANHISWADILVLGSLGQLSFVAKSEVKSWPLFGTFAVLQNTIFIERNIKKKSGEQAEAIASRLKQGDVLVLFAEGTSTDGNHVAPFKSSLFGAAKVALQDAPDGHVLVQPVSIAYTKLHGIAMGRYHRPVAGWPGNVALIKSLMGVVRAGAIDVEVTFGEPHVVTKSTNRKKLAISVESEIRAMHRSSITGSTARGAAVKPSQMVSNTIKLQP